MSRNFHSKKQKFNMDDNNLQFVVAFCMFFAFMQRTLMLAQFSALLYLLQTYEEEDAVIIALCNDNYAVEGDGRVRERRVRRRSPRVWMSLQTVSRVRSERERE